MNDSETSPPIKRPASHTWAFVVYVAVAGTNIMLNFMGHYDVLGVVVTIAGIAALFASLRCTRSPRTYILGVIALGLALLRSVQSLWFDFHGVYRDAPFHPPQRVGLTGSISAGCVVVLLLFLFRAYTFGAPSRRYYGLPSTPNSRSA